MQWGMDLSSASAFAACKIKVKLLTIWTELHSQKFGLCTYCKLFAAKFLIFRSVSSLSSVSCRNLFSDHSGEKTLWSLLLPIPIWFSMIECKAAKNIYQFYKEKCTSALFAKWCTWKCQIRSIRNKIIWIKVIVINVIKNSHNTKEIWLIQKIGGRLSPHKCLLSLPTQYYECVCKLEPFIVKNDRFEFLCYHLCELVNGWIFLLFCFFPLTMCKRCLWFPALISTTVECSRSHSAVFFVCILQE